MQTQCFQHDCSFVWKSLDELHLTLYEKLLFNDATPWMYKSEVLGARNPDSRFTSSLYSKDRTDKRQGLVAGINWALFVNRVAPGGDGAVGSWGSEKQVCQAPAQRSHFAIGTCTQSGTLLFRMQTNSVFTCWGDSWVRPRQQKKYTTGCQVLSALLWWLRWLDCKLYAFLLLHRLHCCYLTAHTLATSVLPTSVTNVSHPASCTM